MESVFGGKGPGSERKLLLEDVGRYEQRLEAVLGWLRGKRYSKQREEQVHAKFLRWEWAQSVRGTSRPVKQEWSEGACSQRGARSHSTWKVQGRRIDFILSVMGSLWRALSREVIWSDFPFWKIHLSDLPFGKIHLAWGEAGMEARRPIRSSWRSREEMVSLAMVEGVDKGE